MKFVKHNGGPPLSFTKRVMAWTLRGEQRELLVDPTIYEEKHDYGWFIAWEVDENIFIRVNAETVEFDEIEDGDGDGDEPDIFRDIFR